jgi:hemerythrin-like domain-containing protein
VYATVNAGTEARTVEFTYQESIADCTTRFINKRELSHLELNNLCTFERFVASMTEEVLHQMNASWLNAKTDENKKWRT